MDRAPSEPRPATGGSGDRSFDARYRALVEQIPVVTYVVPPGDPYAPCLHISPQIEHLVGYTPEEWIADPSLWVRTIHPDDRERILGEDQIFDARHGPWDLEYRMIRKDGGTIWVLDRATILPDADGNPLWHGVLFDATRERLAEAAQRATQEQYRALVEQLPAIVYVVTNEPQPRTLFLAPQAADLTGFTIAELTAPEAAGEGGLYFRQIDADDLAKIAGTWMRAVETEEPFVWEYRFRRRDGEVIWVRDHSVPIRGANGGPTLRQGVVTDITEQKQRDEALRQSEERYRTLVEQVPAVVYLVDVIENAVVYTGPSVEAVTGFPPEALYDDPMLWIGRVHPDDADLVRASWRAVTEATESVELEYRFIRSDGRMIWVKDRSGPVRDGSGSTRYRQGLISDVSDRIEREQRLRASEQMYRALVENIPAVIYALAPDGDGSTLYVSPHVERVLGYNREEWLDQPDIWMELLHPDDRERVLDAYDRANETGQPWSEEYRLIADDGRSVWFRDDATLLRDDQGNPRVWQGVRMDITELKEAGEALRTARDDLDARVRERTALLEEANEMMMLEIAERKATEQRLRRAEEKYRSLVEQIPGAVPYVWEVDPTGEYPDAYTSPAIEELLGFTPEEWHDADFYLRRVHPDDYERLVAATRRSERTGEPFDIEVRYLHKDGRVVWVQEKAELLERGHDGRPRLFNAVMLDITERKEAENRVRAAEDRQRALLEHIPGAVAYVWECGSDGRKSPVTYTSPQLTRVLGFSVDEWHSRPGFWRERVHPDDRDEVITRTQRCDETGEPFAAEYRFLAKDGRVVWVIDQAVMVERNVDGSPWLFQGVFFDVTDRKRYEQQIVDAEARYRTLVEQIPAIVYVEAVDRGDPTSTRIVFVSPQVEALLGYTGEELVAEPNHLERLIHPDDWPGFIEEDRRANHTGTPFSHVYRAIAKDGSIVWLQSKATLIRDEEGRPRFWHGVAIDITPRVAPGRRGASAEPLGADAPPADVPNEG